MRPQPTVTHRSPNIHRPTALDTLLTAAYGVAAVPAAIWGFRALMGILAVLFLASPVAAELTVCVGKSIRIESTRKPCQTTAKRPGRAPREVRMVLAEMEDMTTPAVLPAIPATPIPHVFDANGLFLGRFISNDGGNWWIFTPSGETQIYGSGDGVAYGFGNGEPVLYDDVAPPLSLEAL